MQIKIGNKKNNSIILYKIINIHRNVTEFCKTLNESVPKVSINSFHVISDLTATQCQYLRLKAFNTLAQVNALCIYK